MARELGQYRNATLRALQGAARARISRLETGHAHDPAPFLGHDLDAVAIGSIKGEPPRIPADGERLRGDVRKATHASCRSSRRPDRAAAVAAQRGARYAAGGRGSDRAHGARRTFER